MFSIKTRIVPALLALSILGGAGCSKDDDNNDAPAPAQSPDMMSPGLSLVGTVVSDARFSTLKDALQIADLVDVLEKGEYTVFAPTNEAFAKIPADTLNALLADKAALTQVLLYHVVAGSLKADKVLGQSSLTTANSLQLTVSQNAQGAFINDSKIIATDILANNGVIHAIDTVLLPAAETPAPSLSLAGTVLADSRFSTLKIALDAAGLVDVLNQGNFTVFAPTNEAFAKIPADTLNALLADKEALQRVLLYHVIGGSLTADKVLSSTTLTTANSLELKVSQNAQGAFINDSKIIATDILANNGVIHAIDTVLLPPAATPAPSPSIAGLVVTDARFSTLKVALEKADLVSVLDKGEYTVFAPTNEAFAKIPTDTLNALLADKAALTQVLLYHVVAGSLKADKVLGQSSLTTANSLQLTVSQNAQGAFINDSKIIATDILANNGVIHAIDTVLLPPAATPAPSPSIADLVLADARFSTLKVALEAAGLVDVLKEGNFTVFAPTNEAFAKIPAATLNALLADKTALAQVLLYHVVGGSLTADKVLAQSTLKTANNLELKVTQSAKGAFINDSKIIATDIVANNGVIHAIDTVLLPPAR